MDPLIATTKQRIQKVMDAIGTDLGTIRTGRATPALVENIVVTVYGGSTKLKIMELCTIASTDTRSLVLTPFDPTIIHEIQKGIETANVGLNPNVDGNIIRINIPSLSAERREELIKVMGHKIENGRIMVRQVRHDAMTDIKKSYEGREDDIKRLEKEVQKLVDNAIERIEEMGKVKEKELLQI